MVRLFILVLAVFTNGLAVSKPREAKLLQMWVTDSSLEISGLVVNGEEFWVVSDDAEEAFIYKATPKKRIIKTKDNKSYTLVETRLSFQPEVDLTKLIGGKEYVTTMKEAAGTKKKHRRWDLEGMARCGDDLYLVNERLRHIIKVVNSKHLIHIPINLEAEFKKLRKGGGNAGLEGIAVDCNKQILFVAKEREPRQLFRIDLRSKQVTKAGDIAKSERHGAKAINPETGAGLISVAPDFSDLFYDQGSLYALERNTYEITKIDPLTFKVKDRISFYFAARGLYQSSEPFGMAEALVLQGDQIYIGFDNNGAPLASDIAKQHKAEGAFGTILLLARPQGF